MAPRDLDLPAGAVVIRFGLSTPFWPISLSYGLFGDPQTRLMFASLDHWLAYNMLVRREDRTRVMNTPNGFLAWTNLQRILAESVGTVDDPVMDPKWMERRDDVMRDGLRLKFSQSEFLREVLLRTGDRPIIDGSRQEELHWCHSNGSGDNAHGIALEEVRRQLRTGNLTPSYGG